MTIYGTQLTEGVTEITWTGELPDAFYDEFVFRGMLTGSLAAGDDALLPGRAGVRQQAPSAGSRSPPRARTPTASSFPAPGLTLLPAAAGGTERRPAPGAAPPSRSSASSRPSSAGAAPAAHAQLVAADPPAGRVVAEAPGSRSCSASTNRCARSPSAGFRPPAARRRRRPSRRASASSCRSRRGSAAARSS